MKNTNKCVYCNGLGYIKSDIYYDNLDYDNERNYSLCPQCNGTGSITRDKALAATKHFNDGACPHSE